MLQSNPSLTIVASLILAVGCKEQSPPKSTETAGQTKTAAAPLTYREIGRSAFNRAAALRSKSVFWREDVNQNGTFDPNEVANLWGMESLDLETWVVDGAFTPAFDEVYREIVAAAEGARPEPEVGDREAARRQAIRRELRQARPTLIHTDLSGAPAENRALVSTLVSVGPLIETLYALQKGTRALAVEVPDDDPASRTVFFRNQGPTCRAPATETDPDCSAVRTFAKPAFDLYPPDVQKVDGFCERLARRPDAEELLSPFTVVRGRGDDLAALGYHEAYTPVMRAVASTLREAAEVLGEDEAAFKAYLEAAARAFVTNDWFAADEAWSKMSARNSEWYLRIGPDEVYFEPCNRKAGFHMSFGRINRDSLRWQRKLEPVKQRMEAEVASLAGAPYRARKVAFKLPDFIEIILNAGDSRAPFGATVGQSLPNWGPVARQSRGRTVAMTNLYGDPDSRAARRRQASTVLCRETMGLFSDDADVRLLGTLLHEAAHNLGPSNEYRVGGKTAAQIFGGPRASLLEELKAQTAALHLTNWLAENDVIDDGLARRASIHDLLWAFGRVSRGMVTADGKPKPYGQLAAIQVGHLLDEGVLTYRPTTAAASTDVGCLSLDLDRWAPAVRQLMARVAGIKARGDTKGAQALVDAFVDVEGDKKKVLDLITERWRRAPKASFVYSIVVPE